jgi:hypothetical protein
MLAGVGLRYHSQQDALRPEWACVRWLWQEVYQARFWPHYLPLVRFYTSTQWWLTVCAGTHPG